MSGFVIGSPTTPSPKAYDLANLQRNQLGQRFFPRTAGEIAAAITPTLYVYEPFGFSMLKRYGQDGTNANDTNALTSAIAVANGNGVICLPPDYAGNNPAVLAAGITIIDFRPAGIFPTGADLLGGGRWINAGGNPEGSIAGFHTQQWVTTPTTTTSAILGTNKVTGNLSAGGGALASGTFELDTYGALTGVAGNIVQALTGQIAIRSTGQTLPLVTGVEGGGGIDRTTATTNITTWVSVQGDAVTNASTSGATITNAYGGRFIQSNAGGITNNNFACSMEGDCMFRVGDNLRIENGSGLATIALTFTSNAQLSIPAAVALSVGGNASVGGTLSVTGNTSMIGALGINGAPPHAKLGGWGTPTNQALITNFNASTATLLQCAEVIAQIITDLKTFGLYGA